MRFSSLLASLSLLVSCNYHWAFDDPNVTRPTISVPFIPGDEEGRLTSAILFELNASGFLDVVSSNGDYQLHVALVDCQTDKIGFRVDPQKVDGKVKNRLLATEGRKSYVVEVSLCAGEELFLGPFILSTEAEYDYVDGNSIRDLTFVDSKEMMQTVLFFSLGQLEPIDSAEKAAMRPIYQRLAQKIIDAIFSKWWDEK